MKTVNAGKTYTTGFVAKLTGTAPKTVCNWFDSGWLQGYRIPGSRDRRIPHESLVRFLKAMGMPLFGLTECPVILFVAPEPTLYDGVFSLLDPGLWDLRIVGTAYDAGTLSSTAPVAYVVDLGIGRPEALALGQTLRRRHPSAFILALVYEDEAEDLTRLGFDAMAHQPVNPVTLAGMLSHHLSKSK